MRVSCLYVIIMWACWVDEVQNKNVGVPSCLLPAPAP